MTKSGCIAHCGFDSDAEQVADTADVTAGGMNLGEDAVGAQRLRVHASFLPGEGCAGCVEAWGGLLGDEKGLL